jgi:arylsulfatase A-like enzyme
MGQSERGPAEKSASPSILLKVCVAFVTASLCVSAAGCRRRTQERPSVLLISIDTLRADHLSCYGYARETSPHLDAFARDAALFENAYAQAPFTLTSHMSIFTSLFPESHDVTEERKLSSRVPLLTEVLRDAGYTTLGFYSGYWLDPTYGFARGFDRYERHHSGDEAIEKTLSVLPEVAGTDKPFFLFFHLMDVHSGPLDEKGQPLYNAPPAYRDFFLPHPELDTARHLSRRIYNGRIVLTEKERANVVAQYDGGILYADWIVGQLLRKTKELGLYEPALIIVTSDHGESLGDHGTFKGHGLLWENGLRVPLLVKLPKHHGSGVQWQGKRLRYRVQSIDVAPTILSVARLDVPAPAQGWSLLTPGDRVVLAQRARRKPGGTALVDGRYKLVGGGSKWSLFDLVADPGEVHSLHAERPNLLRRMEGKLGELSRELRDTRNLLAQDEADTPVTLDQDTREELRALGYLEQLEPGKLN